MTRKPENNPYIFKLEEFGDLATGFLVSTQKAAHIPFAIKRVFWVDQVPAFHTRGNHAGYKTEEVIFAIRGQVEVRTETKSGKEAFFLSQPNVGLYIPAKCWITLTFSEDALLLCLASTDYDPQDIMANPDES